MPLELSEHLAANLIVIVIGKHGGMVIKEDLLGRLTQNSLYHTCSNVLLAP